MLPLKFALSRIVPKNDREKFGMARSYEVGIRIVSVLRLLLYCDTAQAKDSKSVMRLKAKYEPRQNFEHAHFGN